MHTLYWFTRDLRLHDNAALLAASKSDMLLCVYVVDPRWFAPGPLQSKAELILERYRAEDPLMRKVASVFQIKDGMLVDYVVFADALGTAMQMGAEVKLPEGTRV